MLAGISYSVYLPPEMCITSPYIIRSCVILGTHNSKRLIDLYLQPLIDELKELLFKGSLTYDISTKHNFGVHSSLMLTINDFRSYEVLSSWMMTEKVACPYCMKNSKVFT